MPGARSQGQPAFGAAFRVAFLAIAGAACSDSGGEARVDAATLAAAVDPVVEGLLKRWRTPGAVVAIAIGGDTVVVQAYGLRDAERGLPMRPDTPLRIGSVSKMLTASAVACLVESGRLDWDTTLGGHFGDAVPAAMRAITLRQLATHTAGLPNDPRATAGGRPTGPLRPFSREEVLTTLASVDLVAAPGETWSYSSLGYALLGIVLADREGTSFERAIEKLVLRPVGMESSGAGPFGDLGVARSLGYSVLGERRFEVPPYEIGEAGGFGGIWSTAGDLAKFGSAHIGAAPGPWSEATRADLHEPRLPIPEQPARRMATGFVIEEHPRLGTIVGQNGEIDGYSACLAMVPATRTSLAVLANTSNVAELITRALLQRVVGRAGG